MGSAVLIVTFDNQEQADKALKGLKQWKNEKRIELGDAVVIVKDEEGEVKIHETSEFTTKRGAVSGGVAGLVIGTVLGGPVGGLVLGAAAGALAGKKIDLGVSNDEIAAVSESMENASSAIAVQIKSVKNKEMLASAIRQSGGKIHELSITDALEMELEDVAVRGSIR
jgi:uncharacterized membrane protein